MAKEPSKAPAGPSTASYLGGAALVGAAAGYAALAMRFRRFGSASTGSGSAEMRAAEAFAGEYVRGGATKTFTHAEFSEAFRKWKAGGAAAGGAHARATPVPDWALGELGLAAGQPLDLEAAKLAYRARARESHPDGGGDAEEFKRVSQAWQVVKAHAS